MNIKHIVLVLPFLFTGCSAETSDAHEHPEGEAEHVHPEETASAKCPGCNMAMPDGAETTEVAGMQFYFCSDKCAEAVKEDPSRFASYAIHN